MTQIKHGLVEVRATLTELGAARVLVLTGKSRRFVATLEAELSKVSFEVFDGAQRHVPEATLEAASERVTASSVDTVIALGGGSAIGLAKALRLRHELRFIAIPTTFSGSERTNLYGTTRTVEGVATKQTGRDDRVRPDVIVYDPALLEEMPLALTITSAMNAAAHALAALSAQENDEATRRRGVSSFVTLFGAIETLVRTPADREARRHALSGAGEAASLLEGGAVSQHHRLAHRLGGAFDLDHAALHSVLLPYTVHQLRLTNPERLEELTRRLGVWDLEGHLFDLAKRARAQTSLAALGVPVDGFERAVDEALAPSDSAFRLASLGRRPSRDTAHASVGARCPVAVHGGSLNDAELVILALHGRDSTAEAALSFVREFLAGVPNLRIVAPQAPLGAWYQSPYQDPHPQKAEQLALALAEVEAVLTWTKAQAPNARLGLFGFSQGACLALEVLARYEVEFEAVAALSGARIVGANGLTPIRKATRPCTLLLGVSEGDGWIRPGDVEATARAFGEAGYTTRCEIVPGSAHALHQSHRLAARALFTGVRPSTLGGFGGTFESEALPGALPRDQNSPLRAPYGLYPEQINGTAFTAPRRHNLRSWLYRLRPSAQLQPFQALQHETFTTDFTLEPPEPNLSGWRPCPIPSDAEDFIDGVVTLGGGGDLRSRRGYAIHWYAANRSMESRAFCDADGDLLLIPQAGALTLVTELGVLDVRPGQVALLPRGFRFSVLLPQGHARGFLAEVYGRHFELPERGVIGANGLADPRHFQAPSAWFEDRLELGYRIVTKFGGRLHQALQDHSPYDVVAWHGNYTPYVYDLAAFVPASMARVDHADPSIYSVLSCPLDEGGNNLLDLIVFPPRWDPTEHTFRPAYFHRNATMEWNAVIRDPTAHGTNFEPGVSFLTPPMTPHGVRAASAERALMQEHPAPPHRIPDASLWLQLESSLPLQLSPAARDPSRRIDDWATSWGAYRNHFRPER